MKSKPEEKNKKATNHPTQHHWHEMNRKQRRETMRKIQSEELSLEVIHPHAAGIDIGNESHYVAGTAEPRQPTGTTLRMHHRRAEGHGRLAAAMRDSDHRHAASTRVVSKPMPAYPPVTMATLPERSALCSVSRAVVAGPKPERIGVCLLGIGCFLIFPRGNFDPTELLRLLQTPSVGCADRVCFGLRNQDCREG